MECEVVEQLRDHLLPQGGFCMPQHHSPGVKSLRFQSRFKTSRQEACFISGSLAGKSSSAIFRLQGSSCFPARLEDRPILVSSSPLQIHTGLSLTAQFGWLPAGGTQRWHKDHFESRDHRISQGSTCPRRGLRKHRARISGMVAPPRRLSRRICMC